MQNSHLPTVTPKSDLFLTPFLWFNEDIQTDGKCIYFRYVSKQGLNFVGQLFDLKGKLKNWATTKNEYDLLESKSLQWV